MSCLLTTVSVVFLSHDDHDCSLTIVFINDGEGTLTSKVLN